jgi:hypothetical protein
MSNDEPRLPSQVNALVVYESMFGSAQKIAHALAEGLRCGMNVNELEVSRAPTTLPLGLDLLVVAAPTHAFGLSRPSTRAAAAEQADGPLVSCEDGVREWLVELEPTIDCRAAAIDTRSGPRRLPGSAARGIEARLQHIGYRILVPAESFWVPKERGELLDGEQERARTWGANLAALLLSERLAASGPQPGVTEGVLPCQPTR